jgi:Family of unknown function (DUF6364)
MSTTKDKITLTVRRDLARKARSLSRKRKQSVSRMFEDWVMRMSESEDPLLALAGLWKDRSITLEELRAKAWSRS